MCMIGQSITTKRLLLLCYIGVVKLLKGWLRLIDEHSLKTEVENDWTVFKGN